MVMGLNNSTQTWKSLLTKVLSDMLFKSDIVYVDDVLMLSSNFNEYTNHLRMFLIILERRRCALLLTGSREYYVYVAGRLFSVYRDHLSLKYLQSLKVSANNRLDWWALALQPCKFGVNYNVVPLGVVG